MTKMQFDEVGADVAAAIRVAGDLPVTDATLAVEAGKTWMRNLETGEAVLVTATSEFMTRYQNSCCDGEVRTEKLLDHFVILNSIPDDAEPA